MFPEFVQIRRLLLNFRAKSIGLAWSSLLCDWGLCPTQCWVESTYVETKCQCVLYNRGSPRGHMSGYKVGVFFFAKIYQPFLIVTSTIPTKVLPQQWFVPFVLCQDNHFVSNFHFPIDSWVHLKDGPAQKGYTCGNPFVCIHMLSESAFKPYGRGSDGSSKLCLDLRHGGMNLKGLLLFLSIGLCCRGGGNPNKYFRKH